MCSCHENKGGDGGGGEKKTVLFKKDRGAEQTTKGEKQSPVIAFAIKQSAGDSKCTVEGLGLGGAVGRAVGGGAAHCQPVKDAGTIQCAECVEQITASREGDLLAGGQDKQRARRVLKMLTLTTAFQYVPIKLQFSFFDAQREIAGTTLCVCVCLQSVL